jgi:hypothetical protein
MQKFTILTIWFILSYSTTSSLILIGDPKKVLALILGVILVLFSRKFLTIKA